MTNFKLKNLTTLSDSNYIGISQTTNLILFSPFFGVYNIFWTVALIITNFQPKEGPIYLTLSLNQARSQTSSNS